MAARAGILIDTVLAWDNDPLIVAAYKQMHVEVAEVLCCELDAPEVVARLAADPPDLVTMTVPCGDYTTEGLGVEGPAAACTVREAQVVCEAQLPLALFENVVQMLSKDKYRKACEMLHARSYDMYECRIRGTDFGMACSRRRV